MSDVEQVKYSFWGDQNAPKGYFATIDYLAHVIANDLASRYTPCDSTRMCGRPRTTISVMQAKEKFGEVRVYCTLASPDLVLERWRLTAPEGEPSVEFQRRCYLDDVKEYRRAYLTLVNLVPQYRSAIVSAADHPLFLATTREEVESIVEHYKTANFVPWNDNLVTLDDIYKVLQVEH